MTSVDAHLCDDPFEEFNSWVRKQVNIHIYPLFALCNVLVVSRWQSVDLFLMGYLKCRAQEVVGVLMGYTV
jgi:hypothetical protein